MDDAHLLRYSRHILLEELGIEGQQRLLDGHALIVGAGGLGAPVALYLGAGGVGRLTIADGDAVDLTNLQRQVIHDMDSLDVNKAESAARRIHAMNPDARVDLLPAKLAGEALAAAVAAADVVLDCSDNFATRHAVNAACVRHRKPLVSGAALSFEGQLMVFDPRQDDSPCYHCLFPAEGDGGQQNCATFGVFSPLVGVIGTMQALEAMKLLAAVGQVPVGRLRLFDALASRWREVRVPRDPACPVCGHV